MRKYLLLFRLLAISVIAVPSDGWQDASTGA